MCGLACVRACGRDACGRACGRDACGRTCVRAGVRAGGQACVRAGVRAYVKVLRFMCIIIMYKYDLY